MSSQHVILTTCQVSWTQVATGCGRCTVRKEGCAHTLGIPTFKEWGDAGDPNVEVRGVFLDLNCATSTEQQVSIGLPTSQELLSRHMKYSRSSLRDGLIPSLTLPSFPVPVLRKKVFCPGGQWAGDLCTETGRCIYNHDFNAVLLVAILSQQSYTFSNASPSLSWTKTSNLGSDKGGKVQDNTSPPLLSALQFICSHLYPKAHLSTEPTLPETQG